MLIARVSCCRSYTGKKTELTSEHIKKFDMDAKLNDKNLQALEAAKMGDMDLGMTTPALLSAPADGPQSSSVKMEFPTLPLLDE